MGTATNSAIQTAVSAGVPILTAVVTPTATAGAGTAVATASLAVPLIGAAVAGVALAITALLNRKGPKQKVETTRIVDQLEPLLKENVEAYLAGPRTVSSQAAALASFDHAWAWLTSAEACGNPAYGNPGRACIADRQRGGKWDWFAYYRDPISGDGDVRPDPPLGQQAAGALQDAIRILSPSATPEQAQQWQTFLILAAIAGLAVAL